MLLLLLLLLRRLLLQLVGFCSQHEVDEYCCADCGAADDAASLIVIVGLVLLLVIEFVIEFVVEFVVGCTLLSMARREDEEEREFEESCENHRPNAGEEGSLEAESGSEKGVPIEQASAEFVDVIPSSPMVLPPNYSITDELNFTMISVWCSDSDCLSKMA